MLKTVDSQGICGAGSALNKILMLACAERGLLWIKTLLGLPHMLPPASKTDGNLHEGSRAVGTVAHHFKFQLFGVHGLLPFFVFPPTEREPKACALCSCPLEKTGAKF